MPLGRLDVGGLGLLHDPASDGDVAGPGALLVDVLASHGGVGGLKAETNIFDISLLLEGLVL